jgi:CheY-like chemotaxis protein
MPEGGTLSIETRNVTVAAYGEVGDLEPGDYVLSAVSDTGMGMPPDIVEHAFEPFFTTKEVGKGTGLGLSQVYGFARQSGGTVAIDSDVGVGTTVRLYLPRTQAPADAAAENAEEAADGHAAGTQPPGPAATRILIVDDDEDVRDLAATYLRDLGYDVVEADTAWKGMTALEADQQPADILIADYAMPGMTGGALVEEARLRHPGLPVLMITGYAEGVAVDSAVPVLAKPFKLADLAAAVQHALASKAAVPPAPEPGLSRPGP